MARDSDIHATVGQVGCALPPPSSSSSLATAQRQSFRGRLVINLGPQMQFFAEMLRLQPNLERIKVVIDNARP